MGHWSTGGTCVPSNRFTLARSFTNEFRKTEHSDNKSEKLMREREKRNMKSRHLLDLHLSW